MKLYFDNLAMSSVVLWLDNVLVRKGEAYINYSGQFYQTNSSYNGYYAYSAAHKPFVYDVSVAGPTVPSGVYLNNTFITTGTSGFAALDYRNGCAYFTSPLPANSTLSGQYAIKDFVVDLTEKSETEILFETKFDLRPKIYQAPTGIPSNKNTYPIILLRKKSSRNQERAFGGEDTTVLNVTAVVMADSQFALDGVLGLMRDTRYTYVPVLSATEQPFNALGDFRSGRFNYSTVSANKVSIGSGLCVEDAKEVQFDRFGQLEAKKLNPDVYFGMIDFTLTIDRYPRQ